MKKHLVVIIAVSLGCSDSSNNADNASRAPEKSTSTIPADELKAIRDQDPIANSIGMQFRQLPAGSFRMGSGWKFANFRAPTPRLVRITQPFAMGVYEVTQEQYKQVTGKNPSYFVGEQNPVEQVSWHDAVEFCRKLSELPDEVAAGRTYRLPTEAEWEYACQAGSTTGYHFGDDPKKLGQYDWFAYASGDDFLKEALATPDWDDVLSDPQSIEDMQLRFYTKAKANNCRTHPVGKKKPNNFGLYDMHGNVQEWCHDWYRQVVSTPGYEYSDPSGPSQGEERVYRGGHFASRMWECLSAARGARLPSEGLSWTGFRVVLVQAEPLEEVNE